MAIHLTVNGRSVTVDVPGDTPLLWVLRDVLHMRGTKYGCGIGQCGSCMVHLGGQPAYSCITPVSTVSAPVTTIEGLSADGSHPIQRAWLDVDVPQCGYCQAGQMMTTAALLAKTPHPTDAEIDSALNRNLCRCGTYVRIREAVHKAAALMAGSPAQGHARNADSPPAVAEPAA
jgi:isoquinoline 1-oxidoreductase alpha subunit